MSDEDHNKGLFHVNWTMERFEAAFEEEDPTRVCLRVSKAYVEARPTTSRDQRALRKLMPPIHTSPFWRSTEF